MPCDTFSYKYCVNSGTLTPGPSTLCSFFLGWSEYLSAFWTIHQGLEKKQFSLRLKLFPLVFYFNRNNGRGAKRDTRQLLIFVEHVLYTSLVVQTLKSLLAKRETRVRFLGQEEPLEEKMATLSSILAWGISWTEEPGGLQSKGSQKSQTGLNN